MLRLPHRFASILCTVLLSGFLVATASAALGGFTATLSQAQKLEAGLGILTPEENRVLDGLIATQIAAARNEGVSELSGTFSSLLSDAARASAGLNRLQDEELQKLNDLVARAVAGGPKPKERPRLREEDVLSPARKPQIHGEVTLAYGWGGGGDFRVGSLWMDYFDPQSRIGIGIGITSISGDGYFHPGYGYGFYGPRPFSPFYDFDRPYYRDFDRPYYRSSWRNDAFTRDDFGYDSPAWNRDFDGRRSLRRR